MKNITQNIILFSLLILSFGCKKNKFINELDIKLPESETKLAVTTHINPGQRIITAFVSQSMGALVSPDSFSTMPIANVRLLEDGNLMGEFFYDEPVQKHTNLLDFPIENKPGTLYRMEVDVPGFESVWAEQTMPEKVEILSAEYTPRGTIDFEGEENDELVFEFKDPSNSENFYKFRVFFSIKFKVPGDTTIHEFFDMLYIDSLDPLLEYGADENRILNDRTFNGDTYKARVFFWPLENWLDEELEIVYTGLLIELGNMTNDKYLYLKTLEAYRENKDNPFSEPVTVHHNFEKGTGIFTLENSTFFVLDIE